MKVQIVAKVINGAGESAIKAVETEADIPDIEEFGNGDTFLSVFDRYEQAVLKARNQVAEEITAAYLEAAASEDAAKKGALAGRTRSTVEAEIGRIEVVAPPNMLPEHKPTERIRTIAYSSLALRLGAKMSFRHATQMLNSVLRRADTKEVKDRTFQDFCNRTGTEISKAKEEECKRILTEYHVSPETGKVEEGWTIPEELRQEAPTQMEQGAIEKAIEEINQGRTEEDEKIQSTAWEMEVSETACCISLDEVGVKHQKEHRGKSAEKHGAYVQNTVAKVESAGKSYIITGIGVFQVCLCLLSYLLNNQLLAQKTLIFFTDGARDIRSNLEKVFGFRPYRIILDWYHLKKRCTECLSMSFQCRRELRKDILQKLLRILWVGNTEQAQSYLRNLDGKLLRTNNRIDELCCYIAKHSSEIPCYALRKKLDLKISSNAVEKANDLVVAQRQKHNGMSWSVCGSGALAQIKTLILNGEEDTWLREHRLPNSVRAA